MAIRVTQQFIQYVADPSSSSDVRVTRVFSQVPVQIEGGVTVENVAQSLFGGGGVTLAFEDFFYFNVAMSLFSSGGAEAAYNPIIVRSVNQSLGLSSGMLVEALYWEISHSLFSSGAGSVAINDFYVEVAHFLGFTERTILPIGNFFGFSGTLTEAEIVNVAHFIFTNPSQNNKVIQAYNVDHSLGFVDLATLETSKNIGNSLGFVSAWSVDNATTFDQVVTEGSFLRQTISLSIDSQTCREKEYAPLIGSDSTDEFDDFAIAPPTVTPVSTITLEYPKTSPTHTLTLFAPSFGNLDGVSFTRINRSTRGGDRKVFSDPKWATWERLTMDFSGVSEDCNATIDQILDFLNASINGEIKLTDWESRTWAGKIIAPETTVSEQVDGFQFNIVFEGQIQTFNVQHGAFKVVHGDTLDTADDVIYEE